MNRPHSQLITILFSALNFRVYALKHNTQCSGKQIFRHVDVLCFGAVKHPFVLRAYNLPKPPAHSNGKPPEPTLNSAGDISSPFQLPALQSDLLFPTTFSKRRKGKHLVRKETEKRDWELDVAHLICNLSQLVWKLFQPKVSVLDNLVTRLINQLRVAADGGSYSNELNPKE